MKGITQTATVIVLLLLAVSGFFLWKAGKLPFQVAGQCKNIYAQQYEFICCVRDPTPYVLSLSSSAVQCPTSAVECSVTAPGYSNVGVFKTCWQQKALIGYSWVCDGVIKDIVSDGTLTLQPGQWAYSGGIASLTYYSQRLDWCGKSGCTQGVPVQGATGCTFKTDLRVYDGSGMLTKQPVEGQSLEYTVPYGSCYLYTTSALRTVIGDTCELCTSDGDCIAGHTYTYTKEGKTYGAEFLTGQLQLYGCKQYGQKCLGKDVLPSGQEYCVLGYGLESRCEVVAYQSVQCLPNSDTCGPNAFCDPATFTCKSSGTVECSKDWECGQATSCDYTTKTIKGKACQNSKCVTVDKQTVQCCLDVNCPSGYFCAQDYTCKETPKQKTTCPYECCERMESYFDKACPANQYCVDNKCTSEPVKPTTKLNTGKIIALLAGILSFLLVGANALRKKDWVGITIALVIGLVVGLIVFWIINLPWYVKLFGGLSIVVIGLITLIIMVLGVVLIRQLVAKKAGLI